jgi:hypothetical protein
MLKKFGDWLQKRDPYVFWGVIIYLAITVWWQWYFVYPFIKLGRYWDAFDMIMGVNPICLIILGLFVLFVYALADFKQWIKRKITGDKRTVCEIYGHHFEPENKFLESDKNKLIYWCSRKGCNESMIREFEERY